MKQIITLCAFVFIALSAFALNLANRNITFAWDAAPTNSVPVDHYNFYQLGASNVLVGSTTNLNITISNVPMASNFVYAVTAVDTFSNESVLSAAVMVGLPSRPLNCRVTQMIP